MKIVVLYEELAWYFVNCLNVLAQNYNCSIIVFCKKNNASAPFKFDYVHPNITLNEREKYTEEQLLTETKKINPDAIFLCGWIYKPYLSIVKKSGVENCILGLDNQWNGSLKQFLGSLYFRLTIKPFVKRAFVPGKLQSLFAERLGFSKSDICEGAYCCDYKLFDSLFQENKAKKELAFPKRFLFVGRYAKEKAITDLWEAFIEISNESSNEWELWCLGIGTITPVQHPKIKHFGFKQPYEINDIVKNTGVFVLPSVFEPWGVVVHEYVTAGFPLICSDKVGAAGAFVKDGKNGFVFHAGNKTELKINLKKFIEMSSEDLNLMSHYSAKLASTITPEIWARNFIKLSTNGTH